jgi:hypothetical protein
MALIVVMAKGWGIFTIALRLSRISHRGKQKSTRGSHPLPIDAHYSDEPLFLVANRPAFDRIRLANAFKLDNETDGKENQSL